MWTSICEICGKPYSKPGNRVRRFCSRACWVAWWTERQRGDGNVAKKPGVGAKISAKHKASGRFAGENSANYKGGWTRDNGRRMVLVATNTYRRRSHIVWDQTHPDDPVLPGEIIHHMNHDQSDDRPENLMKLRSQRDHAREHELGTKGTEAIRSWRAAGGTRKRG